MTREMEELMIWVAQSGNGILLSIPEENPLMGEIFGFRFLETVKSSIVKLEEPVALKVNRVDGTCITNVYGDCRKIVSDENYRKRYIDLVGEVSDFYYSAYNS